ncbi:hypothetical protein ABTE32_22135, partial [Acinetobacter baumannii]
VAQLVTKDDEQKIVVLSALSGTTNALVEISNSLAVGDRNSAKQKIEQLSSHYHQFINDLVSTGEAQEKAKRIIAEHFDFLHIIL